MTSSHSNLSFSIVLTDSFGAHMGGRPPPLSIIPGHAHPLSGACFKRLYQIIVFHSFHSFQSHLIKYVHACKKQKNFTFLPIDGKVQLKFENYCNRV